MAFRLTSIGRRFSSGATLPFSEGFHRKSAQTAPSELRAPLLGETAALLFPVDWPEPFGLVMIEAMACGTPVLAFHCGSTPEVIENGVTGEVVNSEEEALAPLPKVLSYNRRVVRQRFEDRYTATRMAKDYVNTYRKLSMKSTTNREPQTTRPLPYLVS